MEGKTSIAAARKILGKNFIGPDELSSIKNQLGISIKKSAEIPPIPFDENLLESLKESAILVLSVPLYKDNSPLTILKLREHFGWDPSISEPCFYNQDWYLKELFVSQSPACPCWNIINKNVLTSTRKKSPELIASLIPDNQEFPSAFLLTYAFFAFYLHASGEILWKCDYLWCSDFDHKGDRIYVGRYIDPVGINKNGFSVHRHLSIRECYGFAGKIFKA
jgi:hypothetical protein